jgi:hypothetical protein
MLKVASVLFGAIDIPSVLGGFLIGVLLCVGLYLLKRLLRVEVVGMSDDRLSRFRDPNAFSGDVYTGSTVTSNLSFVTDSKEHVLPDHVTVQITEALRQGNKIEAIKIFKDATGLGLKESKDIIEALQKTIGK